MYLINQKQIRDVQWLTSIQWDVLIEGVPSPFDKWFPATDINVSDISAEHHSVDVTHASYDIPKAGGRGTLTLTCLDDQFRTLYNWYFERNNEIYSSPSGVLPLESSLVNINVVYLNTKKETLKHLQYSCLPDGNLNWNGDSNIAISTISLTFKIMGIKVITDRTKRN